MKIRVSCKDIKKGFKIGNENLNVLNGVNFDFESDLIYGITGKNRSGKTTLLRIIEGVYKPPQGILRVEGKTLPLINLKEGLRPRLDLRQNLFLLGGLLGMSRGEVSEVLEDVVDFSELSGFRKTKISHFSEGMKERLVLSLAIHSSWDILLSDEAFAFCDEKFRAIFMARLLKIKKDKIIIFVSHDSDFLKQYCDKILHIDNGKILISS